MIRFNPIGITIDIIEPYKGTLYRRMYISKPFTEEHKKQIAETLPNEITKYHIHNPFPLLNLNIFNKGFE